MPNKCKSFLMGLPKAWRIGIVSWIIFTPYYVWLFYGLISNTLPSLRLLIAVFWIYLIVGYFILKIVLKKLHQDAVKSEVERNG